MRPLDFVKIFTGSSIIVQRVIFDLENTNIKPIVKDQTESARLAGFGGGLIPGFQQVFVHKDQLEKALPIIESITFELETQDHEFNH
ncbi:hypothetical protein APS56_01080 [Pseudalgibacter alginicilyticus]|uniref:DUF2007 domain-containing protein n=1 Tax=Pseudalgibacter alginicilyticus TaxID=1736674 RepID=A0A0P0CZW5_9FLAO|nr:DUF2007 domain-containing protein [Pseudalgibacter alginicilyticus]ALJ03827.1 hypothetical protein APS56_01080 [Pseudalgibacter alginicilyticus]